MPNEKDGPEYRCGYVIHFSDGLPPEETVLHEGTKDECEELRCLLPGIAYSSERPDPKAFFVVVPAERLQPPPSGGGK
jgi:hypothetical protein